MNGSKFIRKECYRMQEGEEIVFCGRFFSDAFICGFPSIYRTPVEAFLSSMIDSGRGTFRARVNIETGDIVVSRHKPEDKRYYIDPDREYMFDKLSGGTLELKGAYKIDGQPKE